MRHPSTKAASALMIAAAALATGACSRSNTTNTVAPQVETLNSLTPGNDASALESIGAPTSNTVAPLPPVSEPTRSETNSAADLPPPAGDEPRPTGNRSSGVQSNVSGM